MITQLSIADEILDLKRERRAVILAHHYQDAEIQDLADAVGDSLELARKAQEFSGDVIAFCGVWFMAETAKVLNPQRKVVVPDREASCSLVESCRAEDVRAYRRRHPDHVIVSYINTSVEVKAESDILCTSRNAVAIVNSIPADQPILFPARHQSWQLCETSNRAREHEDLAGIVHCACHLRGAPAGQGRAREHPNALVAAHPECPAGRARHGRLHRLHVGHYRLVRVLRRRRIHRHDRERRAAVA